MINPGGAGTPDFTVTLSPSSLSLESRSICDLYGNGAVRWRFLFACGSHYLWRTVGLEPGLWNDPCDAATRGNGVFCSNSHGGWGDTWRLLDHDNGYKRRANSLNYAHRPCYGGRCPGISSRGDSVRCNRRIVRAFPQASTQEIMVPLHFFELFARRFPCRHAHAR